MWKVGRYRRRFDGIVTLETKSLPANDVIQEL
jgi:hypothetical protein